MQTVVVELSPRDADVGGTLTITGTSAQTGAIAAPFVDVQADTACFIKIGVNPVAVLNTSYRLPADVVLRLALAPGDKIAVIGTGGNFWYHPVTRISNPA